MRKILAATYCPRCGERHELGMELRTSDSGIKYFYDGDSTCGTCKARLSVYVSEDADFLSVTSTDFGDNPYSLIREDPT